MKCALTYRLLCDCCKLIVETPFCIHVIENFAQHALQHLAITFKTNHPLFFLLILSTYCRNLCCQCVYFFFSHKAVDQFHVAPFWKSWLNVLFSLFAHFFFPEDGGAGREGSRFGTFQFASNQQLGSSHIRKLLITANCGHYHGKIK